MEVATKNKNGTINLIAIFSLYFLAAGVVVVNPAMAKFATAFPGSNFALIATMPTLTIMISTLWAGVVVGKKLKYRTLAILGCVLFLIGGTLPAFLNDFVSIIVCRAVFGIGIGLLTPLGNGLIIGLYKDQKQATYLGYGTLVINGGAVILQLLGGVLADMNWHYIFLAHLLGIISLILAFFLPEPQYSHGTDAMATEKEKMNPKVYLLALLFFIYGIISYPIMVNMALLFEAKGAGGAVVAGTALSLFTIGGAVGGFAFGFIFKRFRRYCLTGGYALCAVGVFIILIGPNAVTMTIGAIFQGFGYALVMPALFTLGGMVTPPSTVAMGISIMMAMMNLAAFVSTFYLNLLTEVFGENIFSALIVFIAIVTILAAVFVFINPFSVKTSVVVVEDKGLKAS